MLFYVNLQDADISGEVVDVDEAKLEKQAWRSVSVVTNNCAVVLYASQAAPDFLRGALGKVYFGKGSSEDG